MGRGGGVSRPARPAHSARVITTAIITLSFCACRRESHDVVKSRAADERPLDRLLPGELAEGKEQAFGLLLPREMRLERVFDDSAIARGKVGPEALAEYVKKRVETTTVEFGQGRIVFAHTHPAAAKPGKLVRIEIAKELDATVLLVSDVTPPPVPAGLSDEERWRKAGVQPGKPFNPNAL